MKHPSEKKSESQSPSVTFRLDKEIVQQFAGSVVEVYGKEPGGKLTSYESNWGHKGAILMFMTAPLKVRREWVRAAKALDIPETVELTAARTAEAAVKTVTKAKQVAEAHAPEQPKTLKSKRGAQR